MLEKSKAQISNKIPMANNQEFVCIWDLDLDLKFVRQLADCHLDLFLVNLYKT